MQELQGFWEIDPRKEVLQKGRISTANSVLRGDCDKGEYIDYIEVKSPEKPLKTEFQIRLERYNRKKRAEAGLKWTAYGLGVVVLGVIVYKFVLVVLYVVVLCTVGSFFVLSNMSGRSGQTDGQVDGQTGNWTDGQGNGQTNGMSGTVNVYGDGNNIYINSKNQNHVTN